MAAMGLSPFGSWIFTLGLILPALMGCQNEAGPAPTSQFVQTPGAETPTPRVNDESPTLSPGPSSSHSPAATPTPSPTPPADDDNDGISPEDGDCDDTDPLVYPGAEEACDGLDNDCDWRADEGALTLFYPDNDSDTFGVSEGVLAACTAPERYADRSGDCDDNDPGSNPDQAESCGDSGADEDCDGLVDEGVGSAFYPDVDGDGVGDDNGALRLCAAPEGYVEVGGDCADGDPDITPGNPEYCHDGRDNDCDGAILPCQTHPECALGDCPTLIGTILSGPEGEPLPGASLRLSPVDAPGIELSVLSDSEGAFIIEGMDLGPFEGVLEAQGHKPETIRINSHEGTQRLWTVGLTPEGSPETGQLRSLVKDATTGLGVEGVSVAVYEGLGVGEEIPILRDTTTPSVLDLPLDVGNYTVSLSKQDYEEIHYPVYVSGESIDLKDLALSPIGEPGALRATLTWGSAPRDLDLYLEHRDGSGALMYTVYYDGRSAEGVTLDLDDRNGSGPETLSLSGLSMEGSYEFLVRDYSNRAQPSSLALAHSGAELILYEGAREPLRVPIPLEPGNLWRPLSIIDGQMHPCWEGCVEGEE